MIIYAIYQGDSWEGWYLGFYSTKLKAREAAKELVAKEQEEIKRMQMRFPYDPYKDFRETENNVWTGGYQGNIRISVTGITVK